MSAASLAQVPLAAGSALFGAAWRVLAWAAGLYMKAPLANTAGAALVGFTLMAGGNALYLQQIDHPRPLFGPATTAAKTVPVEPVVPAVRRAAAPLKVDIPAEVPVAVDRPIDNADVRELQRKLQNLQFFDGTVDGLYGPRTARAIRKFEEARGLKIRGELTREILDAVAKAPLSAAKPAVEPKPLADPLPRVVTTEPKPEAVIEPLAAPAPLVLDGQSATPDRPLTRELPKSAEEAFDLAVETAGDAIDTIIAGVQTVAMKRPEKKPVQANSFVAEMDSPVEVAELPDAAADDAPVKVAMVSAETTGSVPPAAIARADAVDEVEAVAADVPELDTDARPEDLMPAFSVTDPATVARVQRGLASLGFLHGEIDGVAGEATARAIRNFEVYYNYKVTGRITPELPDLLVQNGASI